MAYLYRHIRLDNNTPFYIGIGSDSNGRYIRANNKKGRSLSWKDIVFKGIKYEVEIMLDDITWEEACKKEKEFILLYGRKDLGLGPLLNFTDGGEGQFGRKDSEETRLKKSKPKSDATKLKIKMSHQGKDYSYLKNNAGSKKGVKKSQEHKDKISLARKGIKHSEETKLKIKLSKIGKPQNNMFSEKLSKIKSKPVFQYDLEGNFIKEWPSITEITKSLGIDGGNISSVCNGKYKTAGNFKWIFKNNKIK